jgi:signal transduction histidine kinase
MPASNVDPAAVPAIDPAIDPVFDPASAGSPPNRLRSVVPGGERADGPDAVQRRRRRLRWLAQMRWWAITGAMIGLLVSIVLGWTFVSAPAVVAGLGVLVLVNGVLLWRTRADLDVGRNDLLLHATADLLMVTWLLAWSGGLQNPLSVAYAFHVVIGALLNGRRGAIFATAASLVGIGVLWWLEAIDRLPMPALLEPPAVLWVMSLAMLLFGLAYLALEIATRQARERQRTAEKQEEAERALQLLLEMLTALKVGVDVQDRDGFTILQNDGNLARAPAARDAIARAQSRLDEQPIVVGQSARTTERFSVPARPEVGGARERVVELIALRPTHPRVAHAYLTVDRTETLLVEQRHVLLERLATIGRAMQGVAHELNTPLTTMQTLAKDLRTVVAEQSLPDSVRKDMLESLDLVIEETRRCRALTQSLLATANDGSRSRGRQPALEVARRALRVVGSDRHAVRIDDDSLGRVGDVDADRVLQIVLNLVQNALAATSGIGDDDGPRVVVDAVVADDGPLRLRVTDRGPGLPATVRARLFEPFVTTKAEGTGLGLYTSQQLAQELGGGITVEDVDGGGTRMVLSLPRS